MITLKPEPTPKLKPCPFCGGVASVVTEDVEPQGDPWYGRKMETFIACGDCGTSLFNRYFHEGFSDINDGVREWNTRPIEGVLVEALSQISRMKVFLDPVINNTTLAAAIVIADKALKQAGVE